MAIAKMRCPQCDAPVRYYGTTSTLVGYINNGPCRGDHDNNCKVHGFLCNNKHNLSYAIRNSCGLCGWKGKASCFCCTILEEHPEWSHFHSG